MSLNPENIRALEAIAGQWAARSRTAPESDEAHAYREDARELLDLARTCRNGDETRARALFADLDDELRGLVPFALADELRHATRVRQLSTSCRCDVHVCQHPLCECDCHGRAS